MRGKAVVLLARSRSDAAAGAVVRAVEDPNDGVQRVALAAVGAQPSAPAIRSVSKLLATHPPKSS